MKKVLLHVCCGPCATQSIETLKKDYDLTLFFYNPCIYPKQEFEKRKEQAEKISKFLNIKLIVPEYDHESFLEAVRGKEKEKEGGSRCLVCFEQRLSATSKYAKENGFDCFATTLTISPHKDSKKIFEISRKISSENQIEFLEIDFKKKDGYKKSIELSKKHNLYRQNYCGCEFSIRS